MTGRAVILGVGGFIGSHLACHLVGHGWDVTGVLRSTTARSRLGPEVSEVRLVEGDASDPDLLELLCRRTDAVFPFAGRSGAAASMHSPFDDLDANGRGQLAVLESLRRVNPDARVVFPGSRLQYGRCQQLPVPEDHPQRPLSVYGAHKVLGEHYHHLYRAAHGIPTTVLRISNPYGPGQDRPDARFGVVGTFLATASRRDTISLYGGGLQLRDYLYIGDLVRLCELVATEPAAIGQVFNASGPAPVTLHEMAETVVATVGAGDVADAEWPPDEAVIETGDYFGDITRAAELLGWKPEVSLRDGLASTWNMLAPHLAGVR